MSSKIDVINKEGRAIEEAVAWHTVGIVAEDGQSIEPAPQFFGVSAH